MEFDWENTGDYGSIAEIIDKRSTFLSSKDVSLGAASALSCSPTEPRKRRLLLGGL